MLKNKKLLVFAFIFVIFGLFQTSVSAKDEWTNVRSKNFNLIGNASEKDIRGVATKLEQFRETFRLLFSNTRFDSPIPTNVVVFKSAGAYKPFKPRRADGKADVNIAGYFQPGEDVNYITLSTEGENAETYGTIFHEYVHFMVDTNFGKSEVPPWFNEGLAEYYQTFAIEDDQKVKLGLPQSEHLYLLQQTKLIPLDTLFKISNYALHQNGNHSRSIFYAESWALIHYLIQSGKTEGLSKFLTLVMKDVPAEKAFQDAFQTTYAQMEKDLRKYVAQNTYKYQMATFKNKLVFDNEMKSSPLPESEINTYLGDLLYHTNRDDEAESYLQKAILLAPNSSMANTTFGMVKLRQRKYAEAKNYLEKAVAADQKNHLAYYRYAYLLSREHYDEFGYVSSFPAEISTRMRTMLNKAIAVNPNFTESYELMAFISLVNNENLDEAVGFLQKALRYQPGNQRYAIRIAEIYLRQNKFAESSEIADKIAKTADEPQLKSQAENLVSQIRQRREYSAQREKSRKEYEAVIAENNKNGGQSVFVSPPQGANEKPLTPDEIAKIDEEAKMSAVNQAIRKAEANEKQIIGQIQKIECKGKNITYTIKANGETFTLFSRDFESLALTSFVADAENIQVGCNAKLGEINMVLTYKSATEMKPNVRGELTAIDFVPKSFHFVDANQPPQPATVPVKTEENASPVETEGLQAQRRGAMMQSIKNSMRQVQAGEKRELGFIEKVECSGKGITFHFKTPTRLLKLTTASPQAMQMRAFTPEAAAIQFGCGLKQVDIPVVFTYKESAPPKNNSDGEIVALEFVPKSFRLEN